MALQGNLEDFGLVEILQLIAVQRKSGVLKLTSESSSALLFFEKGNIVSLSDRREKKTDALLDFLSGTGRLTGEQVQQVVTIRSQSKKEIAEIVLSAGYMNAKQLSEAVEQLARELLPSLVQWKRGSYVFSGDERTVSKLFFKVPMRTEALLMESVRRIDESARMRELYSPSLVVRATQTVPTRELQREERLVLDLIDGKRPISEIVVKSRLGEFNTYEILDRLVEQGLAEVTQLTAAVQEQDSVAAVGAKIQLISALKIAVLVIVIALVSVSIKWVVSKFEATPVTPVLAYQSESTGEEDLRLAVEVYRALNGVYPDDLRQLVKAGFAKKNATEMFSYTKTAQGFVLERR